MSPVGHSLAGLAVATVATREWRCDERRVAALLGFVALANLPDWPLPGWGHSDYRVSHNAIVNAGLIAAVAALVVGRYGRKAAPLVAAGAIAWMSHLLLDSFYNHGQGVGVGWPVSDFRLNLPVPWLRTLDLSEPLLGARNLSVFALELATFGPAVLLATIVARRRVSPTLEGRPP